MHDRLIIVYYRRVPLAIGIILLTLSASWGGWASLTTSPVVDESPHLAAGISYVQLLDYRLNPEHPPLSKLAAGIASQFVHPVLPLAASWWQDGINEQWRTGEAVLWDGTNHPGKVLAAGRIGVLLLNLLLLAIIWRIAVRQWDEWWGLGLLTLLSTSPFVIGHAYLITTDITAAFMTFIALYAYSRYHQRSTWQTLLLTVAACGVAQLAKFSLLLIFPSIVLLALYHAYTTKAHWREYLYALRKPLLVSALSIALVVYPTYLILTWQTTPTKAHSDAQFLLSSFAGGPMTGAWCNPMRCGAEGVIVAAGHQLTKPLATYGLGVLMVAQRSAGGNTIYFDGQVGAAGSKWYFPVVYGAKETIPALLLLIGGLIWYARRRTTHIDDDATFVTLISIIIGLYLIVTFRSSLNIGVRHIFPLLPLAYYLALRSWRQIGKKNKTYTALAGGLVILHAATGLSSLAYPLAYYNAFAGGTAKGYLIAADSNYDWGQDALQLDAWMKTHNEKVAIDMFGATDVQAAFGPNAIAWKAERGNPAAYDIPWLVVSVNNLLNKTGPLVPGEPRLTVDEYRWLQAMRGVKYGEIPEPDMRLGTSLFVYKIK